MTLKKKIIGGICIVLAIALIGWLYLWLQTHNYVRVAAEEIAALEVTLEHMAERLGEDVVTDAEARQLHLQVNDHLDSVNQYPSSTRVTGFTDEHHDIFRDMILKLEELLETHRDDLIALGETADAGNFTSDPPSFDPGQTAIATSSLPDSIEETIETVEGHLVYSS